MADLQMNKWIAAIVSGLVIVLQILNGLQEASAINVENGIKTMIERNMNIGSDVNAKVDELKKNELVDNQEIEKILALLKSRNAVVVPSPTPTTP
jgi:hypothetical protein